MTVINGYEHRHWTTVIRWVLSRFLGWRYRSSTSDRRRLVGQLPLIASVRRLVRPDDHFQKGWMPEPQLATGGNLALGPGRPDEMSTGHRHGNTKNNDPSLIERIAQAY